MQNSGFCNVSNVAICQYSAVLNKDLTMWVFKVLKSVENLNFFSGTIQI